MDQLLRGGGKRSLGLPCRIFGQRMQRDKAHLVVQSLEAAERVEHAVAPEKSVRRGRKLVAIRAQLEFHRRAVIVQIARHDAILQHSSEGDTGAAGRPRKLSRQREVGCEQHQRACNDRQAAANQPDRGNACSQPRPHHPAGAAQPKQHAERCAVGRRGERGEREPSVPVTAPALQRTAPQELRAALRPGHTHYLGPRSCAVSLSIAPATSRHCASQLLGKRNVRSAPSMRRSLRHMPGVAASRVQRATMAGVTATNRSSPL